MDCMHIPRKPPTIAAAGAFAILASSFCALDGQAGPPSLVGPDPLKQLVLDARVIASTEGLHLVLGQVEKEAANPLFQADRPWENALNNLYPNVLYDADEKLFKLWYKCVLADKPVIEKMMPPATIHDVGWFLLYATSTDGIAWTKPSLGQIGFDGSQANNIVARDTPNAGVFKDTHDPDPSRRYKMIYDVGFSQLRVRFSPDGIRWSEPQTPQGLALPPGQGTTGDTHNNAFWDERLGKYVLITRIFQGQRTIARSVSADFLDWQTPELVLKSAAAEGATHQTYCMPAFPYANGYLGYVMMYHAKTGRTVDCELAWSPDTVQWERVCPGKPFIPRGPAAAYDSGCIYAPAGPAIVQDGKLMIFYGGSQAVHQGWKRSCLPCLARLRADGWAGYEPSRPGSRGTLVSQPMRVTDQPLCISADAAGGSIRVTVVDTTGYSLAECAPIASNVTDAKVTWNGKDSASLQGKVVRLKFELANARLYAFRGLKLAEPRSSK